MIATLLSMANAGTPLPHPRIWLDAPTITRLQAARTANSPEWQSLDNWCSANLGQNLNEGYQYLDWYNYTLSYGLAYRVSGNAAYGNEGVKYLTAMLRDRNTIGDGLGGTNAILIDAGYVTRSLGAGVAIGRDWLDGAPNLSPALITECTTRMNEWYNLIHVPATYGINEPTTNYFAGHFAMTYSAFIAFEGDPGYQAAWETKSEAMWVLARDMFNTQGDGGDSPEGWNYAPRAFRHMLGYPWALETGTTRPNHWDEIDITSEIPRAHISMLHPSREMMSDDGRWSGDYKGDPRSTTCLMMSVLSDTDATAKGLAVWYANNLEFEPGGPDRWENFLFTDSSITPIAPTAANIGGLTWKGWGHSTTRGDEWTNQEATFVDAVGWTNFAEEANFGEIKITSRQEQLLCDGQTYQLEGEYTNMPRITGTHTYAPYQEYWHAPSSLKVDSVDHVYTFFRFVNLDYAYNGVNDDDPSAAYFERDAVFLVPDHVIVLDNIRSTTVANTITEQWYLMGNPTLSGDTATLTKTNAKLFLRTVSPAVTLSEADTDASRDGTFRLDAAINTPSLVNHVLTVFEASDESQPAMTPATLLSPPGFVGVQIHNATTPQIVLFATAENPAGTSCSFSFVPDAAATRVVITGIQPSANFTVNVTDGGGGSLNVSLTSGTGITSQNDGSLTFVANSIGSSVVGWQVF
ncbi:hypothetical protein IT570_08435 [Candidatus Sumerlaeota bacterium]|nr:hypothetical protein [Candidatus Sumerlaeota bacterium]